LRSLGESTPGRDLINGAKAIGTSKQSIYNPQKKNKDTPWIEASGKKRNRKPRNDNIAQTTKEKRTSNKQTCDYIKFLRDSKKYSMMKTT